MLETNSATRALRSALLCLLITFAALTCVFALDACSNSAGSASSSSSASSESASASESTAAEDESEPASESASASESTAAASESEPESESASEGETPEADEEDPAAELEAAKNEAQSNGLEVFEGTLRILSADELMELQQADPHMPEMDGTFAVLVFDQATDVVGQSGDGSGERTDTATMLGVAEYTEYSNTVVDKGDLESWRAYDGQRIAVAAYPEEVWFPSDVSLPIGEPRTGEATIL